MRRQSKFALFIFRSLAILYFLSAVGVGLLALFSLGSLSMISVLGYSLEVSFNDTLFVLLLISCLILLLIIGLTFYLWFVGQRFWDGVEGAWEAYSLIWYLSSAGIFVMGLIISFGFLVIDFEFAAAFCGFVMLLTVGVVMLGGGMASNNFFAAVTQLFLLSFSGLMIILNAFFLSSLTLDYGSASSLPSVWLHLGIGSIPWALNFTASILLVIDAYRARWGDDEYDDEDYIEIYDDEDDDYDDSDEINPYDVSSTPAQSPRVRFEPPPRVLGGDAPDINWYGEFLDDGYEWIEWPEESDSWWWRDPNTGEWVDYRG